MAGEGGGEAVTCMMQLHICHQRQEASEGIGISSEVGWPSGAVQTRISWTDLPRGIIHKIYARRVHDSRRWNIFVSGSTPPLLTFVSFFLTFESTSSVYIFADRPQLE